MLEYPNIDPTLVQIGGLEIRWYGLFYIIAFLFAYLFLRKFFRYRNVFLEKEGYDNLLFLLMIAVIVGGRIGYVLFYNPAYYLQNPLKIFALWEGGLSFHGGAIAVVLLGYLFCRKHNYNFYQLADPVTPFAAIGIGLVRLGNFINAELYGRVTDKPWGMIFPTDKQQLPRHPSQLYQAFLEGVLLFIITFIALKKSNRPGICFWLFITFYGIFRFIVEFYRQPDEQLGFIIGFLTMGQILSGIMVVVGIVGIIFFLKKKT